MYPQTRCIYINPSLSLSHISPLSALRLSVCVCVRVCVQKYYIKIDPLGNADALAGGQAAAKKNSLSIQRAYLKLIGVHFNWLPHIALYILRARAFIRASEKIYAAAIMTIFFFGEASAQKKTQNNKHH